MTRFTPSDRSTRLLHLVPPGADTASERIRLLTEQARCAGYRLRRAPDTVGVWELVDTEDNDPIHTGNLDRINDWLNS